MNKRKPTDQDVLDVLELMTFELKGEQAQALVDDEFNAMMEETRYDLYPPTAASGSRC